METGDFMEPGQQALCRVEHRGAVEVFGVSSARGVRASRTGPTRNMCLRSFFSVIILSYVFSTLWLGQPSNLYSVWLVLHSFL
jgi:hypothetical protein